jgi:hypothetical protein
MPQNWVQWISLALWLAAVGHFCVLIASFQVPSRLRWKEDLAKLMPFNRKLLWVHGGFAVYTILAFGVMSVVLHDEMIRGERGALVLATFIGVYWLMRIVVDFTYYSHEDWPKGRVFAAGHALLTALFAFLSITYVSLSLWHFLKA